jgi:tetratricopeptide (TPR) repeat protein
MPIRCCRRLLRLASPAALLVLTGCATTSPSTTGTEPASETASPRAEDSTTQAVEPRRPTDTKPATLALLQQSQRAEVAGSLNEAIAYTERAIRINPRQADLWIRLATLELSNQQPQSAIQYANKALSLAADRRDWQRQAWLVIADAKNAMGETSEATAIRERWQTYKG